MASKPLDLDTEQDDQASERLRARCDYARVQSAERCDATNPTYDLLVRHEIAWVRTSPIKESWWTVIAECRCGHESPLHERADHLSRVLEGEAV